MLILEVYEKVGLTEHIQPDHYSQDFMCHRSEEWFVELAQMYSHEIFEPPYLPGDAIIFKHGRLFSHGGIIIDWPLIIHASVPDRCVLRCDLTNSPLMARKYRVFRHKDLME